MYIVKNALRCIARSMGRNVLIGIIALVIAISACLGLSIRQAAESSKKTALEGMSVTATISYKLADNMNQLFDPSSGRVEFDKDIFEQMMNGGTSLTLEEYEKYASASTVSGFYYTLTAYFNGANGLEKVSNSNTSYNDNSYPNMQFPNMNIGRGQQGDFTVVGFSDRNAMTEFINGTATILDDGTMFTEGTEEMVCIIPEELAIYNSIEVGEIITIANPELESEVYELTVIGIYSGNQGSSMFDSANKIYMSSTALQIIAEQSEITGSDSYIKAELNATYSFSNKDDYDIFCEEVYTLGLDESYTVESSDLLEFEQSLSPLNSLSKMAGWFLVIILIIGGVILVVLNIFNVRERKYEVGVLTAMGMKKWRVAAQFICEILIVTMVAIIIGAGIGAVSSVPVTNALLEDQINSQTNKNNIFESNFNSNMSPPFDMPSGGMNNIPNVGGGRNPINNLVNGAANYITEVNSAMNLTVVFQMIGVGILLTLIASAASVLFIMRYDPLKILSNRD